LALAGLPLAPNASVDLLFPIPPHCFDPDCDFRITVDVANAVAETNEGNNVATGVCLG
jgi:subtilase family serine protease